MVIRHFYRFKQRRIFSWQNFCKVENILNENFWLPKLPVGLVRISAYKVTEIAKDTIVVLKVLFQWQIGENDTSRHQATGSSISWEEVDAMKILDMSCPRPKFHCFYWIFLNYHLTKSFKSLRMPKDTIEVLSNFYSQRNFDKRKIIRI